MFLFLAANSWSFLLVKSQTPPLKIVSGSWDKTIRVWSLSDDDDDPTTTATRQVTGHRDKTVRLWNATTGECVRVLTGHTGFVLALRRLSPERLASAAWDARKKHIS